MRFDIKKLFNVPMILMLSGIAVEVVALIVYVLTGVDEFNEALSTPVLVFAATTIALGVILLALRVVGVDNSKALARNFDTLITLDYVLGIFPFMFYIASKVNYLANVFVSIDGTKISPIFVITVLFFLIAFAVILASAITAKKIMKEEE